MSEVKCVVVEPDGTARNEVFDVDGGGLTKLQQLVGGYIEGIGQPRGTIRQPGEHDARLQEGWTGYINEDGKSLGLAENRAATLACATFGWRWQLGDFCVGPIVFVGAPDNEGYDTDVPKFILRHFNLED